MPDHCLTCGCPKSPEDLGELCPRCLFGSVIDEQSTESSGEALTIRHEAATEADLPANPSQGSEEDAATSDRDQDNTVGEDPATIVGGTSIASTKKDHLPNIPDYEDLTEIARGGMGVVYRAVQKSLDRTVAIKLMLAGRYASEEEQERFLVEAKAAAQLDHPTIVPIYQIGEADGHRFFSMAFVEGEALDRKIARGDLSAKEAAAIVERLAEAVFYAHSTGVIHRDLKPGNVLMDASGEPRITDFGLAKRLDDAAQLTATGQALGTPSFMAPEQAVGKPDTIGTGADIYALGAILYTMLTGRPPFVSDTTLSTMMMVLESEPTSISDLVPNIDRDIETICLKCLEKKPEDRYATAEELAMDLKRYLNHEPIAANPVRGWRMIQRWRQTIKHNNDVRLQTRTKLFGIPLVDIAFGRDLEKDEEIGHAKGIFAVGDRATGVFAYGGTAVGLFAMGQYALGGVAFGMFSAGLVSCGLATIGAIAFGGLTIGGFTFGALCFGYIAYGWMVGSIRGGGAIEFF